MTSCVYNELKRAVLRWSFLAGVALQVFLLWLGAREDWGFRDQVDAFYLFALSRENAMFSLFSPMAAMLPYVLAFAGDWQHKAVYYQLHRSGVRRYNVSRIAAGTLSGGLALAMGTFLYALACILLSPQDSLIVEVWRTYADGSWLESAFHSAGGKGYMWLSVGLDSLAGMVWACVGLLAGILFRQPIVAVLTTQATYLTFLRVPFLSALYKPNAHFVPSASSGTLGLERILLDQWLIIAVVSLLTALTVRRAALRLGVNHSPLRRLQRYLCLPGVLRETDVWLAVLPFLLLRPFIFTMGSQSAADALLYGLGGFPYVEMPTANDVSQWFLLLIPPLMVSMVSLRREASSRLYMTLYRFGGTASWLWRQLGQQALVCAVYVFAQAAVLLGWAALRGLGFGSAVVFLAEEGARIVSFQETLLALPLLAAHLCVLCFLTTLAFLLTNNGMASVLLALLISVGSAWLVRIGQYRALILGYTGMLLRSSLIYPGHVNPWIQIVIQIGLCALLALACQMVAGYSRRFVHRKAGQAHD